MRRVFLSLAVLLGCCALAAEQLTLPAAASIVGGAPFFSDVRAFNTSYTQDLDVSARYRCFIPQPCNPATPSANFTLTPRESRAFNDIVVSLYNAPNTAGGIEFEHSGDSDQLVVTSRLYSTAPTPTVGMFIPGLENSAAHSTTVLTSIRNGGAGQGFRTNVGVFNRENSAVNVTFTIFDGGSQVGSSVSRTVSGHSGVQVNRIFDAAGDPNHVTDNAVIVVAASHEVFSYAAVIDNTTTDPIFIVGAEDNPPQAVTPGATTTPTQPEATATASHTPSPSPSPTRTPTPPSTTRSVSVGQGGLVYRDAVSGNGTSTITAGTTVNWTWSMGMPHSVTSTSSEPFDSGEHSAPFSFSHRFNMPGTFTYLCTVHGTIMSGTVIVNP